MYDIFSAWFNRFCIFSFLILGWTSNVRWQSHSGLLNSTWNDTSERNMLKKHRTRSFFYILTHYICIFEHYMVIKVMNVSSESINKTACSVFPPQNANLWSTSKWNSEMPSGNVPRLQIYMDVCEGQKAEGDYTVWWHHTLWPLALPVQLIRLVALKTCWGVVT